MPIAAPIPVGEGGPDRGVVSKLAQTLAEVGNPTSGPDSRPADGAVLRYGQITAVAAGLAQTTATGDAWLTSDGQYIPLVGDLVYLITQGPVGHIIGRIGTTPRTPDPDVQVFTADGTWTKPTAYPIKRVLVLVQGAGGGGGAGGRAATTSIRTGGGGGGSGARSERWFTAADLPAASYSINVGAGGAGANPQTADSTAGAAGGAGTRSAFSNFVYALGGGAGGGGQATGTAGAAGTAPVGLYPGNPGGASSATGGAGASSGVTGGGPGSGGSGGGIAASGSGTLGGVGQESRSTGVQSQVASAVGSTTNNTGLAPRAYVGAPGNGGPGGSSNAAGAATPGGPGNGPGAGGGGGGASSNGSNSGGGGDGQPGVVAVITYF